MGPEKGGRSGERREQRAHLGWGGGQVLGQRGAVCASARRKRTRERERVMQGGGHGRKVAGLNGNISRRKSEKEGTGRENK